MLGSTPAFGTFSTDSVEKAAHFYGEVLGIECSVEEVGGPMLTLTFPHGATFLVYEKPDHSPASHTVIMFPVDDVTAMARQLTDAGVALEHLEWTDADGVARDRSGATPDVAWFKDPAGNWLSIIDARA
jgi:predicted enzyme related to lactoylglutathione lyase